MPKRMDRAAKSVGAAAADAHAAGGGFEAPRRMVGQHEEAGLEETEQLLSRAFGGKLGLLVSNFADHGKIGKDELDELYAILDRAAGREE